jgi:hypothetical protein
MDCRIILKYISVLEENFKVEKLHNEEERILDL